MHTIDRLSHIYSFLDLIGQNLSVDHLRSVHQNPLAYIKTDKEEELCALIEKDERFKGMMEVYGLFRDVISHGMMADISEKSSRVYKMATKLDEVQEKMSYIEEAMGFLVKGLNRINNQGGIDGFTPQLNQDKFLGKQAH